MWVVFPYLLSFSALVALTNVWHFVPALILSPWYTYFFLSKFPTGEMAIHLCETVYKWWRWYPERLYFFTILNFMAMSCYLIHILTSVEAKEFMRDLADL